MILIVILNELDYSWQMNSSVLW